MPPTGQTDPGRLAEASRRRIPPPLVPDGDTTALFRFYAVLAMAKGDQVVVEDVHDASAARMSDQDPNHKSLKPLQELPAEPSSQISLTWTPFERLSTTALWDAEQDALR